MAFRYSNIQCTEMVRTLARCDDNVELACRVFNERHGTRVSARTMLGATQRLRDFGTFRPNTALDRGTNVRSTRLQENILDYFDELPESSTREAAPLFDCSHMYVWRTLRADGEHPFHLRRCQELMPTDYLPRLQFCRWLLENWQRNIIWTDESTFTRVGIYNQHNMHLWRHENPHACRVDSFQHRFSVNVWAGVVGTHILGPVFLPRLTGDTYLHFLQEILPQLLEEVPLSLLRRPVFYQHDGAPAHFTWNVRRHLDAEYGSHWIGRGGPIPWPPRSADLTPLDFFLWGRIKSLVYVNEATSVNDLKHKIELAFVKVKSETEVLNKLKINLRKRAIMCIEQGGGHFENLLKRGRRRSI
ncbi:hypothetical protein PYW07_008038 [Mythimna separata]|uniref:Transposase n=1 Tax=Mythimna separata TaxID=271217 RepID=A0AAD7YRL0_MYTSE|nr:hypothetical protein PYW07_008038 [Mythimna separata]